ncbi:MAG: glycoside hydrolase family 127 protein [Chloroflexota bacterium]
MSTKTRYQYSALPFTSVTIDDAFWSPRIEINRSVTIPYDFQKCDETDRLSNFDKAAGRGEGEHMGIFFNDSDVFKVIEGAAYSLHLHPDPKLEEFLDDLIERIAASQEADGYLYTARTIAERNGTVDKLDPEQEGQTRWSNLRVNHELYNVGHMYEAAVAHFLATGKRVFLDVALKNADLIDSVFGPDKQRDVPGHQEIEMGLVRLYSVTGEERYLRLAQFFLDERGHYHNGRQPYGNFDNHAYTQDHLPVVEQDEALGHAVRAVYMYSGMSDVAALTGEQSYIDAIGRIWENVVHKKFYLTGGIGALHHGEAFGANYELPNDTAYNETCAAIANVFWNQRMFQLHGHADYIDVLERSLYNGFLPGIDFGGDRFFYVNPLEYDGEYRFNRDDSNERLGWFNCSCCPTNVVRLFPSLGGYIYAQEGNNLFVNLYMNSQATVDMDGRAVQIAQETDYPWSGTVKLSLNPAEPIDFALRLRIPGWARNQPTPGGLYRYVDSTSTNGQETADQETVLLQINGERLALDLVDGYAVIRRTWQAEDVIELHLPMPVRRVLCDEQVSTTRGKVALERGPLVYCVEGVDNDGKARGLPLSDQAEFAIERMPELLGGLNRIRISQPDAAVPEILAVPYYAWAHREMGEMAVWLQQV